MPFASLPSVLPVQGATISRSSRRFGPSGSTCASVCSGSVTEDSVAYPVMQRARAAVERYNRDVRRSSFVKTEIRQRECGDFTVQMSLNDEVSDLLRLELMAPTQKQAHRLAGAFSRNAETIYRLVMDQLLSEEKENS